MTFKEKLLDIYWYFESIINCYIRDIHTLSTHEFSFKKSGDEVIKNYSRVRCQCGKYTKEL